MFKFKVLAAALATVFSVGSANALYVAIDDFNSPGAGMTVSDLTAANGSATVSGPVTTTPSGIARVVSHELLAGVDNEARESFVKIAGNTWPASGALEVGNSSGRDSEVKVSWTLGTGFLTGATSASFTVYLLASDGNPTFVDLFLGGASIGSIALPINVPCPPPAGSTICSNAGFYSVDVTSKIAAINAGGTLTMALNGDSSWDLTMDQVGFDIQKTVSEPASLALVGLALFGAGVASRRRSA